MPGDNNTLLGTEPAAPAAPAPAASPAPAAPAAAPAPEPKPAEGQPAAPAAPAAPAPKPAEVPEKYEFKAPEGMTLDKPTVEKFSVLAKELKLPQDAAQKLVDLQMNFAKEQGEALRTSYAQTVESWKQETVKALGAGYEQELGFAAKAINKFGTPELKQLLNETGLGNHKELAMLLIKVGKTVGEDNLPHGKPSAEKSLGQIFYGPGGQKK